MKAALPKKLLSGKLSAMSEPEAKSWLKTVLTRRTSAEKARDAGQSAADNAKEASADAWKATKNGAQSAKESVAEGMGNMNAQMNN